MKTIKDKLNKVRDFILGDLWFLDFHQLSRWKRGGFSLLKMTYIVGRGFIKDRCGLQASALTYFTLMALVPVLVLVFALARGLGAQKKLQGMLDSKLQDLPEHVTEPLGHIFMLVEKTDFVTLGAIGCLMLVWSVIKVVGRVENTFNAIWGVRTSRNFIRKFTDYISVLLVVPLILLVVSFLNTSLSSERVTDMLSENLGPLYPVVIMLIWTTGPVWIIAAFSFLYLFLPNTKVKVRAALMGGLFGGLIWLLVQWLSIRFQVWINSYDRIYGAFASLPVFLFWIWINWIIILFGAEISFAFQNLKTFSRESDLNKSSFATRKRLALIVVHEICKAFQAGDGPWDPEPFQTSRRIPVRWLQAVLFNLQEKKIILKTADSGYVPAKSPAQLTLKDVELALTGTPEKRIDEILNISGHPVFKAMQVRESTYHGTLSDLTFAELCANDSSDGQGVS